jgi:hypothetical protein
MKTLKSTSNLFNILKVSKRLTFLLAGSSNVYRAVHKFVGNEKKSDRGFRGLTDVYQGLTFQLFVLLGSFSTKEVQLLRKVQPRSVQPKFDWCLTMIFQRFDINCWPCDSSPKSEKTSVELETNPVEICSTLLKIGLTAVEHGLNSSWTSSRTKVEPWLLTVWILNFYPSSDLGGWTFKFNNFSRKPRLNRGLTEVFWV